MTTAIDIRAYAQNPARSFLFQCIEILAAKHTAQHFLLLADRPVQLAAPLPHNVAALTPGPKAVNGILQNIWYNYSLPSAFKKNKADVFIGDGRLASKSGFPQILFCAESPAIARYKQFSPATKNAAAIIVTNQPDKQLLETKYGVSPGKIAVVYPASLPQYQPVDWNERESIKANYAEGKEYFLFAGDTSKSVALVALLKAFSILKKWQKSSIRLVITGKIDDAFAKELANYKYREDVTVLPPLPEAEMRQLVAAAYAAVDASPGGNNDHVIRAMQCHVPVITVADERKKEIFEQAALYADAGNIESTAEQLILIFKNENRRNELIAAAGTALSKYDPVRAAEELWQTILRVSA